jgi:uncharacterized membrane protein YsdA (DUF1294 family)
MGRPMNKKYQIRFHAAVGLAMALLGTLVLWGGLSGKWDWKPWAVCWLLSVNVVAFGYYGYDKARARSSRSRVPELVLHGLSAVGGSLGAFVAMQAFRHKTIKGSFRMLFWCIVLLQVALLAWVVKLTWFSG